MAGDITQVRAALLVVNHFNGLPPAGAEAAIDAAMGGAIARRAASGALDTHFGATTFLPTANAHLASNAVMIVGLGDVERFATGRLPEIGIAIVEAVAAFGFREAATIVHGAGSCGVSPRQAAHLLIEGVLKALSRTPGAESFRELTIVDRPEGASKAQAHDRLDDIAKGIQEASCPSRIHVYFERAPDVAERPLAAPHPSTPAAATPQVPAHLRLGIRSENRVLRLTLIGHGALDCEEDRPYRVEMVRKIQSRLQAEVFQATNADARAQNLRHIGQQLYQTFGLDEFAGGWLETDENRKKIVVLRVDPINADLPWELLCDNQGFLSCTRVFGRTLAIKRPGREATLPPAEDRLRVLVISNPTSDLQAAGQEARQLVAKLKQLPNTEVTHLHGPEATYTQVSAALDRVHYDVFHYAGHFESDALRPNASGFMLADGELTADDLSTRPTVPRFFIANACESAQVGASLPLEARDVLTSPQGLVESLLLKGVRTYVGSMWRVNDDAAETFALAFYQALLQGDMIGEAVRSARNTVIEKHGEGQPAWASYVLYGPQWMTLR